MARTTKKDKEFFEKIIGNIYNSLRHEVSAFGLLFGDYKGTYHLEILTKIAELNEKDQENLFKSTCWRKAKDPYIYYQDRKNAPNVEYSKLTPNFKDSFLANVGASIIRRGRVDREFREFLLENATGTLLRWLIKTREIASAISEDSANKIFDRTKNNAILKNLIKIAPYQSVMYGFNNYKGKDKSVVSAFRSIIGYSDVTKDNALAFVTSMIHSDSFLLMGEVINSGFASKSSQEDISAFIRIWQENESEVRSWHTKNIAEHLFAFCTKQTIYSNLFFFKTNCPNSLALKLDLPKK